MTYIGMSHEWMTQSGIIQILGYFWGQITMVNGGYPEMLRNKHSYKAVINKAKRSGCLGSRSKLLVINLSLFSWPDGVVKRQVEQRRREAKRKLDEKKKALAAAKNAAAAKDWGIRNNNSMAIPGLIWYVEHIWEYDICGFILYITSNR